MEDQNIPDRRLENRRQSISDTNRHSFLRQYIERTSRIHETYLDKGGRIIIKTQLGLDGKPTSSSLEGVEPQTALPFFKDSVVDSIDRLPDYHAPDGLKIWELEVRREEVSFWRCIIPPKSRSLAREHPEFKGIWVCKSGECELWRKEQGGEYTITVSPGEHFILTPETHVRLDNQSSENVDFIIAMIPRSPSSDAWERAKDYWQIVSRTHERYLYNEDKNREPLYGEKTQKSLLGTIIIKAQLGLNDKPTFSSIEYVTPEAEAQTSEVVFRDSVTGSIDKPPNYHAPDGLKIWELEMKRKEVSFCRCIIPPKSTSLAGKHPELKEIWVCKSGKCELWRKEQGGREYTINVLPGDDFILTPETHFQLRNQSSEDVDFIIATMPRWPGGDAWKRVKDYWSTANKKDS